MGDYKPMFKQGLTAGIVPGKAMLSLANPVKQVERTKAVMAYAKTGKITGDAKSRKKLADSSALLPALEDLFR